MNNNNIIILFIIFIISVIAILQAIGYFVSNPIYKQFFNLIAVAIIINIFILVFLVSTFDKVKLAPGPPGPKGNRGKQGYEGSADQCGMCGKQTVNLRYAKNETEKRTTVIIENPLLGNPPPM
jgi:hypothetical protein